MQDEIVKRNTILLGVGLIIFFIVSMIVFSYSNRKSLENVLINQSGIISRELRTTKEDDYSAVGKKYTQEQDWLKLKIVGRNYTWFDSSNDSVNERSESVDYSDYFIKAKEQYELNSTGYIYLEDNKIYCASFINDDVIVVSSILLTDNTNFILIALGIISITLLIVLFISIKLTKKTTNKVLESFNLVKSNLEDINNNKFVSTELFKTYPEVNDVMEQINVINEKIFEQMIHIRHEHDKLNFVIDNMDQGIVVISKNGKILLINNYALDVIEKNDDSLVFDELDYNGLFKSDLIKNKIKESLSEYKNSYFDVYNKNGNIYLYDLSVSKRSWDVNTTSDEILFILINDVTSERLEDLKKTEFITNASHELKSPVTSIKGFAEILNDQKDDYDELTQRAIGVIYKQSERMQNTITELLYLSQIDNRVLEKEELELVNLSQIVSEIIDNQSNKANSKKVSLLNKVPKDFEFLTKPELFHHLLFNLVDNAVKYHDKIEGDGYVEINIEFNENYFDINVIDNGKGIEEKALKHIFERFYREDVSHNDKISGTGLGLNIAYRIASVLNGQLMAESTINKGSKFTIRING